MSASAKSWTPLALTILGFAGLGSLATYRILQIASVPLKFLAAACAVIYVGWMLWESRVSIKEISKPEANHDKGTMELCAAVKMMLLLAALAFPSGLLTGAAAVWVASSGVVLLIAGIALRGRAIAAMGEAYSHRIRTPSFPLITSGPYAAIRHPAYAGTLLIHTGVVLVLPNWFSCAALIVWFIAVGIRTRVEDRWLSTFPEYRAYREVVRGGWMPIRSLQARVPLLLSISFFILIAVSAVAKLSAMDRSLAVPLGCVVLQYFLWLVGESKIALGEISKADTRRDQGTCELYALARAVVVLSALILPMRWESLGVWYPIGLLLFLGGIAFRLTAIRFLGQFYSHRIRLADSHKIVNQGPYRFLRHPAYTGMIAAHLGFVICFFNWVSLAVLAFVLVPAVVLRIRLEERALFELEGYPEYARFRRRLVPLLW